MCCLILVNVLGKIASLPAAKEGVSATITALVYLQRLTDYVKPINEIVQSTR